MAQLRGPSVGLHKSHSILIAPPLIQWDWILTFQLREMDEIIRRLSVHVSAILFLKKLLPVNLEILMPILSVFFKMSRFGVK